VWLRESFALAFEGLGEQSQSTVADRATPRVNVREKWVPPRQKSQEVIPTPTFKIPLKPPLLLFDLLASRSSWIELTNSKVHSCFAAPELECGGVECPASAGWKCSAQDARSAMR
jgi:hypothetical protein